MAPGTTIYRFTLALSHVDRGVYESLDLRVACHPSETTAYLLARVLAYAHLVEEGIAFSRGGLSEPDEPALAIHTLDGRLKVWVDIGAPNAERLHKASKAAPRVVVVTHRDPRLLREALAGKTIHRKDALEIYALEPSLLQALEGALQKTNDWALTFTSGMLYVTVRAETFSGSMERIELA